MSVSARESISLEDGVLLDHIPSAEEDASSAEEGTLPLSFIYFTFDIPITGTRGISLIFVLRRQIARVRLIIIIEILINNLKIIWDNNTDY